MKRAAVILYVCLVAAGWSCQSGAAVAVDAAGARQAPVQPYVRYDGSADRLTVDAHDGSLTGILARISRLSGVEILVDPAVEHRVNVSIDNQPLEQGLATLTRGLNSVLVHDVRNVAGKGGQNMLVTLKLLPKGQTNMALLMPVLSPEAEAMLRADQRVRSGAPRLGLVNDRRLARLQKLPPEQRERLEQIEKQRVQKDLQRKAERAERKAQRKRDKLERLNERLQRAQAQSHGAVSPERRQATVNRIMQDIAEIQAELNGTATRAGGNPE